MPDPPTCGPPTMRRPLATVHFVLPNDIDDPSRPEQARDVLRALEAEERMLASERLSADERRRATEAVAAARAACAERGATLARSR